MPHIDKYGAKWDARYNPLQIELECIKWGGRWKSGAKECGEGMFFHLMEARKLLWPNRYRHEWTDLMYENFISNDITILMGCACVSGNTRIPNPLTGECPTIRELYVNEVAPTVMTLDGPRQASIPFVKGVDDLFEVVLDNGNKFEATAKHRVLTPDGYCALESLCVGAELLAYDASHQPSNSGNAQLIQPSDVLNFSRTIPDSQSDYQTDLHSCGEPPLLGQGIAQCASPSQVDARKHHAHTCSHGDDSGTIFSHIPPSWSCVLTGREHAIT